MITLAWQISLVIFFGAVVWEVGRRFHWALAFAFGSAFLSALFILLRTDFPDPIEELNLSVNALTAIYYLFGAVFLYSLNLRWRKIMTWFCFIASLDLTLRHSLIGNVSLEGSFVAVTAPIFWDRHHSIFRWAWPVKLLPIVAVFSTSSTTAYVTLGAVLGMEILYRNRNRLFHFPGYGSAFLAVPLTVWIGHHFQKHSVLHNWNIRSPFWRIAFAWWDTHANHWIGAGLGSAQFQLDQLISYPEGHVIWMHSEWLSILFEQGWLGLVSALTLAIAAFYSAWGDPPLVMAIAASCLVFGTQFPAHVAPTAILLVGLLKMSFKPTYVRTGTFDGFCASELP